MFTTGIVKAATQVYIPSTSTYHNYVINIETGTIRQINTSTLSFNSGFIYGTATDRSTMTHTGTQTFLNLVVTSETISSLTVSTLTVNALSTFSGVSTFNGTKTDNSTTTLTGRLSGSYSNNSTTTLQGSVFNGTAVDNSTSTYTGFNYFRGLTAMSSGTQSNPGFVVGTSSLTLGATNYPGVVWANNTGVAIQSGLTGFGISSGTFTDTPFTTSTQLSNKCSVTLEPGSYMITAQMDAESQGGTWSEISLGIGTVAGNDSTGLTKGDTFVVGAWVSSLATPLQVTLVVAPREFNITVTTIFYMKTESTYSLGQPTYRGRITAVRK